MRLLVWNLRWAKPGSRRGALLKDVIQEQEPDLAILTETADEGFFDGGESVRSPADYGYVAPDQRRKVHLWSRWGWRDVDPLGSEALPNGRFVAATTETPFGPCRVIGVCVPWASAHVSTGRKDRERWEDHERYLRGLKEVLDATADDAPVLLAGDFNQRIPRKWQPRRMYELLLETMRPRLHLATGGVVSGVEAQAIDHLAHSSHFEVVAVKGIPKVHPCGVELSDHFGLMVEVAVASGG